MFRLNDKIVTCTAGLALLCAQAAFADPMKCSGEQKTCLANCSTAVKGGALSICVTNCGQRQAMCVKTGCWDNGSQKYCGLLRR